MPKMPSLLLLLVGCPLHNQAPGPAIALCSDFVQGQEIQDLPASTVTHIEGGVVWVVVVNPRSPEGEDDVEIPCRE